MLDDRPVSLDGIAAAQAGPARPSLRGKVGVLLANLGTPDSTDYWTMRSYLDQFLSDRRVIEWPVWIWQPILKLIV
ncbi:MAG TPA: ferrochelatase, partial [Paracoccaceae bacterium]|nr:ferrochelatase [Paracoccaceae bacterium]